MFDHVIKIAFVVDDIAKAVEFYTTTLDLEVEAR
jgi:catechol 2,3-dioxygenase-like lactoylglutathione lyase family enzyme